jgi:hypothetical protein
MVLERDHQPFHWTQWAERDDRNQRQPQCGMDPIWWLEQNFGHERGADHDRASEKHDKHRRAVPGIGKPVIKPAALAARPQCQKPGKKPAFAAARTGARQACGDRA